MKILLIEENHPVLKQKLMDHGFEVYEDYTSSKSNIEEKIGLFDGIVIRSRIPIDGEFLEKAINLKFIGRVGAGLENIDVDFALSRGISLINAPEGNRDAVAEHATGMLLSLMNRFRKADNEVRNGVWMREENRGEEIKGKTVALIGYGNTGKAFAKRLSGFDANVICFDIVEGKGDENARQTDMNEIFDTADILSLHIPQTPLTLGLVNKNYISRFRKPFYLINTARGKSVITKDLVMALDSGKIKCAGLDVLEFERSSFESLQFSELPTEVQFLIQADNVLLTPHVAGWTVESKLKLAEVTADKIIREFGHFVSSDMK